MQAIAARWPFGSNPWASGNFGRIDATSRDPDSVLKEHLDVGWGGSLTLRCASAVSPRNFSWSPRTQ
jgi:hypothetical protein